jgi:hypothetical protein
MEANRLSEDDDWTLHGVWPDMCAPVCWPQFCDQLIGKPNPFELSQIDASTRSRLEKKWPTLMARHTNEWLWEHEWYHFALDDL